jgi:hypothetical protein
LRGSGIDSQKGALLCSVQFWIVVLTPSHCRLLNNVYPCLALIEAIKGNVSVEYSFFVRNYLEHSMSFQSISCKTIYFSESPQRQREREEEEMRGDMVVACGVLLCVVNEP